jgi:hypothetical protein
VALFHANLTFHTQLLTAFRDDAPDFFRVYQRHVTWNYNPEATGTDILLSTYDWESLRGDRAFISEIIGLLRNQLVAEESLAALRDEAGQICVALAESIGRECDLPAAGSGPGAD